MNKVQFVDGLHREVSVGDLVAFAKREGNFAKMRVAVVDRIDYREKMDGGYHEVHVRSWSCSDRRWRAAREVNHSNILKLDITRSEFESLPSNGFV